MKKTLLLSLILFVFFTLGLAQTIDMGPELKSLVESERAFSKTSAAKGTREAFLTYLAEDAIVFRPKPVPGRQAYLELPAAPGRLIWEPVFAEVSHAGDLGYTTGPWEFRKAGAEDQPAVYGHYVSIWRKQPDRLWRVVIDIGIAHPRPEMKVSGVTTPATDRASRDKAKVDVEAERAVLLERDRAFSEVSASEGAVAAFLSHSTDDIRFYRMNAFPVSGKEAVRAALSEKTGRLTWQPIAAEVSGSGDLGYTYGISEFKGSGADNSPADSSSYVKIWRKRPGDTWKVALDIAVPIPPLAAKSEQ